MQILPRLSGIFLLVLWSVAAYPQALPINPVTSKVKNVSSQFFSLNDHGTPSGFTSGSIDPNLYDHYQGITRHPTIGSAFFLTKNGDSGSPAAILGAYLSKENGGRHMRHNLWAKNASNTHGTNPNGSAYTYWQATLGGVCDHYGGLQAGGKVLAVAADNCNGGTHGSKSRVYLYYIHNSYWPIAIDVTADGVAGQDALTTGYFTAGAVGIIEDSGNRYTVMVFTDNNRRVMFRQFELSGSTMTATSPWLTFITPTSQSNGWETGVGAHQSLNLIRQNDNTLYVGGTQRGMFQDDYMFLYRVSGLYYNTSGTLYGWPYLNYVGKKHMYCTNWEYSGHRMCDFQAAAGFYVVPAASGSNNGELTLIASAHDDDKGLYGNLAPITEFRNKNVRTIDSGFGDCGTSSWATLYDDDHMDGDRNITISEYNSTLEDFKYLHNSTIDFGDKASAISYCIRSGCTLTAYKNSGYGSVLFTVSGSGSGRFGYDNDLKRTSGGYYGINWSDKGDKISSVKIACN